MKPTPTILSLVPPGAAHRVQGNRSVALPGLTVDIMTTRRIELQLWELHRLNDPYWRLYWPVENGGVVEIDGTETPLQTGSVYLIPPHTTFSTTTRQPFSKWYAHFNLGPIADRAAPGIYPFPTTAHMQSLVEGLTELGQGDHDSRFPWISILLVTEVLRQLPDNIWDQQ
ncbi:MAG: hypothetical protein KDK97_07875, partial [Verrucomicrobiales bacterium]|nr:hypothetical protein [Verrucomicrobiales bacterium]